MSCKKFRELILTDYLDGELDNVQKESLHRHLAQCWLCKKFSIRAQQATDELFANTSRVNPPDFIWNRVKEAILAKRHKKVNFVDHLFIKLKYLFHIPKPSLVVASVITFILMMGIAIQFKVINQRVVNNGRQEQAGYLTFSAGESTDVAMSTVDGFGTSIERYFL